MGSPEKEKLEDTSDELESWMTDLPHKLKTIPIIHLAIPGSHDSFTYGITSKSPIAPDAEPIIRRLSFLGPLLRRLVARWGRTQLLEVSKQLKSGIRYFDLRLATREGTDDFYFVHALYSVGASEVLGEIQSFLETHPQEVVILDCQHFYAFHQADHERLMCLMSSIFGHKMLPYTRHMEHLTLEYLTTQFRYQVIVIYRSDAARFGQPLLWPSASFPTPWPDTVSIPKLFSILEQGLKKRNFTAGYVTQCLLTPSNWFVCKHVFSSLKTTCVIPLEREKYVWLGKQKPGHGGINIVISDFVNFENNQFSREVISLNNKLLDDLSLVEKKSALLTPIEEGV